MAGTISFNGLVSGYDTQAIIDAVVSASSSNIRSMQSSLSNYSTQLNLFQSFNGLVSDLQSSLQGIDDLDEITAYSAVSSDEGVLTASVVDETFTGTYDITVEQLAQAETDISDSGYASASEAVGQGSLDVTIDGVTTTVTIDGTNDTLEGVADAINDSVDGVFAYVVDTGDGATPYRLMITSEETGADQAISVVDSGTGLSFSDQVSAQDAELSVNGVTVYSASNTVSDVVPGLNLDLLSTNSGSSVTLTVNKDLSGVEENIQSFVDSYNAVQSFIADQFSYTEEGGAGVLASDNTLRYIQRTLQNVVGSEFSASATIESLSGIGIFTESDGTLSLDSTTLQSALSDDYNEVLTFFTDDSDGILASMDSTLDIFLDSVDGTIQTKTDSLEEIIEDLEDDIDREQLRIDALEESLILKFAHLETTLAAIQSTSDYLSALFAVQNKDDE